MTDQPKTFIDIAGKCAFITGSSRGIGQQIALGLANLGCHIIVHGRTASSSNNTVQLLSKYDVDVHRVHGDLSNALELQSVIDQVNALDIVVDILYNNAAIMTEYKNDIWSHQRDEWESTFKVNVIALYELCRAFMPGMISQGFGRVINLTSDINKVPALMPYGASKWAVDKITDDIACTLDGTGVRINAMHPGWLQTDMGGANADHPVQAVLPGALTPAIISDDGPNGMYFEAVSNTFFEQRPLPKP